MPFRQIKRDNLPPPSKLLLLLMKQRPLFGLTDINGSLVVKEDDTENMKAGYRQISVGFACETI